MSTDVLESLEADYEQRIQERPFHADDTESYVSDDSESYDRKQRVGHLHGMLAQTIPNRPFVRDTSP